MCPSLGITGTTLQDWSGRQRHGTLSSIAAGTIDWTPTAMNFGSTSRPAVSIPYIPTLPFSVSLWFRSAYFPSSSRVPWSVMLNTGSTWNGWYFGVASDRSVACVSVVSNVFRVCTSPTLQFSFDTWHCLSADFISTTSRQVYLDGRVVGTNTDSSNPTGLTAHYLGRTGDGIPSGTDWNAGGLDDLRVYSRQLSPQEHKSLSLRRGIAYEWRQSRWYSPEVIGGTSIPVFAHHYRQQGIA